MSQFDEPLTPEDVDNVRFSATRFGPGYRVEDVDAFLDRVAAELRRLNHLVATLSEQGPDLPSYQPGQGAPEPQNPGELR